MDNIISEQRQRVVAKINVLLGENVDYNNGVIDRVDRLLSEYVKPSVFNPSKSNSITEERDASFEQLCMYLEQKGSPDPRKLTAYQFYKRLELLKDKKN